MLSSSSSESVKTKDSYELESSELISRSSSVKSIGFILAAAIIVKTLLAAVRSWLLISSSTLAGDDKLELTLWSTSKRAKLSILMRL